MIAFDPCDRYQWVNVLNPRTIERDPDLEPIRIDQLDVIKRTYRQYGFPEPSDFPDPKLVIGYGLPPRDQKFKREIIHEGVIRLEKEIRIKEEKNKRISAGKKEVNIINAFWEELSNNPVKYHEEIQWLKKMWHYRLFGYFFFNHDLVTGKSKITYITGSHWCYLNFWRLDTNIPDYRDRDRRWFLAHKYAQTDTTTFAKWIEKGNKRIPVPEADGSYEMKELGRLVCIGSSDPKSRRMGDTSKCCEDSFEYISRVRGQHFAFQGKNHVHSQEKLQENISLPFSTWPFFFKPLWDSAAGTQPKEKILFESDEVGLGIHSRITHATTSKAEHYNHDRLDRYIRDESGNTKAEKIDIGHDTVKKCAKVGSNIRGFFYYPTTIESMEDVDAGKHYIQLLKNSMWNERNELGQTVSGLYNFYFSGADGREGQIDEYGMSIIDDPTPDQAKFTGRVYGAKQEIEQERKELYRTKQWDKLAKSKRQDSLRFREVFTAPSFNTFFRTDLVSTYLTELWAYPENCARPGNFYWIEKDKKVGWDDCTDNPEQGRFLLSRKFEEWETNRMYISKGVRYPDDPTKFIAGGDTFKFNKTQRVGSNGGLLIRERYNPVIDNSEKPIEKWETARTIITYSARPESVEEFCEDCLKACVFTGAMMYPESNLDNIIRWFKDRGYGGFLLYDYDERGKKKYEAGFYSSVDIKHEMFLLMRSDHLKTLGRTPHPDLWEEALTIQGPEELTDYDLTAAYGATLLAERSRFYTFFKEKPQNKGFSGFSERSY